MTGIPTTFPNGTDGARVISVIQTVSARGSGTKDDPVRTVAEYWTFEGKKLAEKDFFHGEHCETVLSSVKKEAK